jgi:hypothetical protein
MPRVRPRRRSPGLPFCQLGNFYVCPSIHSSIGLVEFAAVGSGASPTNSEGFVGSLAFNSNIGVAPTKVGAGGSPKPISGFIALIWKKRLNKRSILAWSLLSTSSSLSK